MNHLAHLYLSRHDEKLMVGNFIADAIKGKKYSVYEEGVARGILMHREIDSFTDSHPTVRHSKGFFRERYGLYASVVVDLFYDHFLAKNWKQYNDMPLMLFAEYCYDVFRKYYDMMPSPYQHMFTYMQQENWLLSYSYLEGIQRSLNGMSRRIKNHTGIEHSLAELKANYTEMEDDFTKFFPELRQHMINGGW